MIEYTIADPDQPEEQLTYRLITSLFDIAQFPAELLAVEYHQRWEVENTIDEVKIHLIGRKTPTRFRIPAKWCRKYTAGCWGIGQCGC